MRARNQRSIVACKDVLDYSIAARWISRIILVTDYLGFEHVTCIYEMNKVNSAMSNRSVFTFETLDFLIARNSLVQVIAVDCISNIIWLYLFCRHIFFFLVFFWAKTTYRSSRFLTPGCKCSVFDPPTCFVTIIVR